MFAVFATSFSSDSPLDGLEVGERPDPQVPDGWTTVQVKAASLNHHDVWSLRGVGLKSEGATRRGSTRTATRSSSTPW